MLIWYVKQRSNLPESISQLDQADCHGLCFAEGLAMTCSFKKGKLPGPESLLNLRFNLSSWVRVLKSTAIIRLTLIWFRDSLPKESGDGNLM